MKRRLIFHRFVQRDLDKVIEYYSQEAGDSLADRFFRDFLIVVEKALQQPKSHHLISYSLRRANMPDFPYHFLYREMNDGIRVLVLRHDRRHPSFGINRQ